MWDRELSSELRKALKQFPAIVLTGPRRAGKTFLLRNLVPDASYCLLEDPDVLARAKADPRAFLSSLRLPVILDEIQNCPELLPFIRTRIDLRSDSAGSKGGGKKFGNWLITGSQEFPIMKGVTESMAGRAAVFHLLPLSFRETGKTSPLLGGFPEVLKKSSGRQTWFRSYLQTYIERDIREIINVRDMGAYRVFIQMLAQRNGHVLNKSEIAAPVGVKVPTITQWLSTLEITNQIVLVKPYFRNFEKRLIKSPKLYFLDSGLLCHLLNIRTQTELDEHPANGFIFESYLVSELLKSQINRGEAREVYYFRDETGLEVDFLVPRKNQTLELIEAKYSQTIYPNMAKNLLSLRKNMVGVRTLLTLIHRGKPPDQQKLVDDVMAYSYQSYFEK